MLPSIQPGTGVHSGILQHIISKYSQRLPYPPEWQQETETGQDLQFWLLSFARSQKFLGSVLAGSQVFQKGALVPALPSCCLYSPFTPPRWKPLPGSYTPGHDQIWEALGCPVGGVMGLINSSSHPSFCQKTHRKPLDWQSLETHSIQELYCFLSVKCLPIMSQ